MNCSISIIFIETIFDFEKFVEIRNYLLLWMLLVLLMLLWIVCVRIWFVLKIGVIAKGSATIEEPKETATMIIQIVQELVFAARTFRIGRRTTLFARR